MGLKDIWTNVQAAYKTKTVDKFSKFTCPFCFAEYSKSDIWYVCHCNKVVLPKLNSIEPFKCKCGSQATLKACPKCSHVTGGTATYTYLNKTMLETPYLPFSILGVSSSGKTNYITVMLHELRRSSGLKLTLMPLTKETRDHQQKNHENIYEKHIPAEATQSGEKLAQIWSIKNSQQRNNILNQVPTYTFTIFDGAGEDHENKLVDFLSPECGYIKASEAVILVIDPLVIPAVRKSGIVDATVLQNSLAGSMGSNKNIEDILNSLAEYIKTAKGMKTNALLKIPVAVVLTKFDTILANNPFGSDALINESSLAIRDGVVSLEEIEQVSNEIRNWFEEIGETTLLNALDANFTHYRFFGVSSYGAPPLDNNTLPNEIKPHRVLDPILWLFKTKGFID